MKRMIVLIIALSFLLVECKETAKKESAQKESAQLESRTKQTKVAPITDKEKAPEGVTKSEEKKVSPEKPQELGMVMAEKEETDDEPGEGKRPQPKPADQEFNTEQYDKVVENEFLAVKENPLSTFSIDVDSASYSNVRRFLTQGQMPPEGAIRIEEMINYFTYDYPQPTDEHPFSITSEIARSPWNPDHYLMVIGLQGKRLATEELPPSNLVFLLDVSGSMEDANKLPLLRESFKLLVNQLREQDKVSIVVYAGAAGVVLDSVSGSDKQKIIAALNSLQAGGSTAGGQGIQLAYQIAEKNLFKDGNNRVILATDGDFNVGLSSDDALVNLIESKRQTGIYLSVLGFGMGNYKDSRMEKLADKGNGNYAYIDTADEAKKVLVQQFGGTLYTIAKDVKIQIEFNPTKIKAYRLIGYETRLLKKEDFTDDTKDAGEMGSGHTVTALYEMIPAESPETVGKVDDLKYQESVVKPSNELMTIKLRYKKPKEDVSILLSKVLNQEDLKEKPSSENFMFATAVAEFGQLIRKSKFKGNATYQQVLDLAGDSIGADLQGYRKEFIELVKKAMALDTAK